LQIKCKPKSIKKCVEWSEDFGCNEIRALQKRQGNLDIVLSEGKKRIRFSLGLDEWLSLATKTRKLLGFCIV
jgi:hypothetical protein